MLLTVLLGACDGEPEPGDPGYEDCQALPSLGAGCEPVDECCTLLDELTIHGEYHKLHCVYVMPDDTRLADIFSATCVACPRTLYSPCGSTP